MQQGLSRPGHEGGGLVAGEMGYVGLPGKGFDADCAADGEDELVELLLGELAAEWVQGLGDPADGPALSQRQPGPGPAVAGLCAVCAYGQTTTATPPPSDGGRTRDRPLR